MTISWKKPLKRRLGAALIAYAFFRWESAVTISLIMLASLGSWLFGPWPGAPEGAWIVILGVGLVAEALLITIGATDPKMRAIVLKAMLEEETGVHHIRYPALRQLVEQVIRDRGRIDMMTRRLDRHQLIAFDDALVRLDRWLGQFSTRAGKLDERHVDVVDAKIAIAPIEERLSTLRDQVSCEADEPTGRQMKRTIDGLEQERLALQSVIDTWRHANLDLERAASLIGTLSCQLLKMNSLDVDDVHAPTLSGDLTREVDQVEMTLNAVAKMTTW